MNNEQDQEIVTAYRLWRDNISQIKAFTDSWFVYELDSKYARRTSSGIAVLAFLDRDDDEIFRMGYNDYVYKDKSGHFLSMRSEDFELEFKEVGRDTYRRRVVYPNGCLEGNYNAKYLS